MFDMIVMFYVVCNKCLFYYLLFIIYVFCLFIAYYVLDIIYYLSSIMYYVLCVVSKFSGHEFIC